MNRTFERLIISILMAAGALIIVSGLAGLYPSVKAARLKPVEVMRT